MTFHRTFPHARMVADRPAMRRKTQLSQRAADLCKSQPRSEAAAWLIEPSTYREEVGSPVRGEDDSVLGIHQCRSGSSRSSPAAHRSNQSRAAPPEITRPAAMSFSASARRSRSHARRRARCSSLSCGADRTAGSDMGATYGLWVRIASDVDRIRRAAHLLPRQTAGRSRRALRLSRKVRAPR